MVTFSILEKVNKIYLLFTLLKLKLRYLAINYEYWLIF